MNENIRNHNTQDIFMRAAIVSLLDLLNRNVNIDLVRDDMVENHSIPFFLNMAHDEGFMKDFFIGLPSDCKIYVPAEGNYEPIPRGIITWKSFKILTSNLTNRYVRGTHNMQFRDENNNKINKAYSSRLFSLPLKLMFNVEITSDNFNKTLKIIDATLDLLYKNNVSYFQYRGIRIPSVITIHDELDHSKEVILSYDKDQYVKTTFMMEMETYYPKFDETTSMFKGNTVRQWMINNKEKGGSTNLDNGFLDIDSKIE